MNMENTISSKPLGVESVSAPKHIIVYVCPTDGCENYYASPEFRPDRTDVSAMQFHRSQDGESVPSHTRSSCPDCRVRGKKVERVPYIVTQVVLLDDAVSAYRKAQRRVKKALKRVRAHEATADTP
jgi:hypothetical protein